MSFRAIGSQTTSFSFVSYELEYLNREGEKFFRKIKHQNVDALKSNNGEMAKLRVRVIQNWQKSQNSGSRSLSFEVSVFVILVFQDF